MLSVSQLGTSDEYNNIYFHAENKKNIDPFS